MAFRIISKPKASYLLPTAHPRFKPKLAPRIGIGGIEKPRIAPRILPTPVSGLTSKVRLSGVTSFAGGGGVKSLTKLASSGTKTSGTMKKPPAAKPVQIKPATKPKPITGSHPAGAVPIPRSISSQPTSSGPKLTTPRAIKRTARRSNPFKIPKV